MQGRMGGLPSDEVQAAAATWGPAAQQRVASQALQQQMLLQQQHQEREEQQHLLQQREFEERQHQQRLLQQQQREQEFQQQFLARQHNEQQQLLLQEQRYQELVQHQQRRQLLLAQQQLQQAEAQAFPEISPGLPDWQLADAGPAPAGWGMQLEQRCLQPRAPALPPLPGRVSRSVASGAMVSRGDADGWVNQQLLEQQQQQQRCMLQQGGQLVDEFGVPIEPSILDDESEAVAATDQASVAALAAHRQPQMLHQLLVPPGPGRANRTAFGQPSGLAAAGQPDGGSAAGQMAAFLNSRSRDFAMPRIGKPLGSRQLTPQHGVPGMEPGVAAGCEGVGCLLSGCSGR